MITNIRYVQGRYNAALSYTHAAGGFRPDHVLRIYVDDTLIVARAKAEFKSVIDELISVFYAHDHEDAHFFLSIPIERDRANRTLKLRQKRLTTQLLEEYGLGHCKGKTVPLSTSIQSTKADGELLDKETYTYTHTDWEPAVPIPLHEARDIAQAVGPLSKYMQEPTTVHWQAAKGLLRYVAFTKKQGIVHPGTLVGYCDADYAGDLDTRRSTIGYVFILHGRAITWLSKRQPTVAASTTEAKYIAAAQAVKEAPWLRTLLGDLGILIDTFQIRADNQSALKFLRNPV